STEDVKHIVIDSKKDIALQERDILLTRKGSFGIAAQVTAAEKDCVISSEVMLLRIRTDAKCSPEFVTAWMNSSIMQRVFDRNKAGGIMGHLTQQVLGDIPIPIPSSESQTLIASKIRDLRAEAQRLRAAAEIEWETAKR